MTRIKEPVPGTTEVPEYKSPPSRIVQSLRKGYDNVREKVQKKSEKLAELRGNLRDVKRSRDEWKRKAGDATAKLAKLEASLKQKKTHH